MERASRKLADMLRHYLVATLRNLGRNRLYAFISIACLSVGLAATFLAAAYIDHLRSYNRWIADYQRVYRISMEYTLPGTAPVELATIPQDVVPWLPLNVDHVLDAARIVITRGAVRHDDIEVFENIAWADPDVFKVLRPRVLSGDLDGATLAVSLAVVGMLGLASSAAEERRMEIGVRKAFGAGTQEILRLVLWPFLKLSGAAGLIGCLIALPLMSRWLQQFEDRIDLQPWMPIGTCVLIVCVAVLTVCSHAVLMARARPIIALRNE